MCVLVTVVVHALRSACVEALLVGCRLAHGMPCPQEVLSPQRVCHREFKLLAVHTSQGVLEGHQCHGMRVHRKWLHIASEAPQHLSCHAGRVSYPSVGRLITAKRGASVLQRDDKRERWRRTSREVERNIVRQREIVVVQLDVKKACDHVEHRAAFKAMRLRILQRSGAA